MNLDWLGENGPAHDKALCEAVEAAGPGGLWIDSHYLVEQVNSSRDLPDNKRGVPWPLPDRSTHGTLGRSISVLSFVPLEQGGRRGSSPWYVVLFRCLFEGLEATHRFCRNGSPNARIDNPNVLFSRTDDL